MSEEQSLESAAEQWLNQLFEDLRPQYAREVELLFERVVWQISLLSPELKGAVVSVLIRWLGSDDVRNVSRATSLVYDLRATEAIPALEKLRDDILSGRSPVSQRSIEMVNNILRRLMETSAEEG